MFNLFIFEDIELSKILIIVYFYSFIVLIYGFIFIMETLYFIENNL